MVLVSLVSYLGEKERNKRFEIVKKTIKDYQNITSEFQVCIFAQSYRKEEVEELKSLNCLVEEFPPKSCSHARNVAIDYFKNHKEYKWMLLSDDDTTLYNYYGVKEFISQLDDIPERVKYINFHQPQFAPFKQDLYEHKDFYENNFLLKTGRNNPVINPCLIRNFENIQYFDENLKMIDDDCFYIQSTWSKNHVYYCPTVIIKNNCIMFQGVIDYSKVEEAHKYIYNYFGKEFNGKYKLSDLINKNFEKEVINIPRKNKYTFTERECNIIKRKNNKCEGGLF